jgi:hypothetical protein
VEEGTRRAVQRDHKAGGPGLTLRVKLQGAVVVGLVILIVHYLMLVHNLMPSALVSFNA